MRINNNKEISFQNNRDWLKKELKQPRMKRFVKAFITMSLEGKIDYRKLGLIYRPDQKIPEATAKRYLKYQEVQDMINEELQKALTTNNITYDSLIKERKSLLDDTKDNKEYNVRLKTIEGFEDMLLMRGQKEVKMLTESVNYKQLLDDGTENELTATKKVKETSNLLADTSEGSNLEREDGQ